MPVNHESPVREGLIIKRSAEMSAAAIGYAQKVACELVCQTQGLEKLSAEEVELIENSHLVPVVMAGLAKIGSYESDVEKGEKRTNRKVEKLDTDQQKLERWAKGHLGMKALGGAGIGGGIGAGLGALAAEKSHGKGALIGGGVGAGLGALLGVGLGKAQRHNVGERKALKKVPIETRLRYMREHELAGD